MIREIGVVLVQRDKLAEILGSKFGQNLSKKHVSQIINSYLYLHITICITYYTSKYSKFSLIYIMKNRQV